MTDNKYGTTVRVNTDDWHGKGVVHCHILEHEDNGLMGWAKITRLPGSCDPDCSNDGCPSDVCTCPMC